jgi:ribosome-binding protein aMBF1 (putative translation factor)
MKSYQQIKKNLLKNKSTLKAYENLGPEFALVQMIIEKRLKRGLTQAELAQKIGTKQSAIARLESGTYNPTVNFLSKVAVALDAKLSFSIR